MINHNQQDFYTIDSGFEDQGSDLIHQSMFIGIENKMEDI